MGKRPIGKFEHGETAPQKHPTGELAENGFDYGENVFMTTVKRTSHEPFFF